MLFRVYNKEKISNKSLIFFYKILSFHWQWSGSYEEEEKDMFICSTLIKSLQVELKSIITSNIIAG